MHLTEPGTDAAGKKRGFKKYRKEVVVPALLLADGPRKPLPWQWLAVSCGKKFSREGFDV